MKIKIPGSLTWTPSTSSDVVTYYVYADINGDGLTYEDPHADVGLVSSVQLPIQGLPAAPEGSITYGVTAVDEVGNESDFLNIVVNVDITPPEPPTDGAFVPSA